MTRFHYTAMLVEDGGVRGLDLHLDRLVRDHRTLFDEGLDRDTVRALLREADVGLTRPTVLRIAFSPEPEVSLLEPGDSEPIRVRTAAYQRSEPRAKHDGIPTGNAARREAAQRDGFDDVLFTTPDGLVSEGSTWNVVLGVDDGFAWPDAPLLGGVTMQVLRGGVGHVSRPVTVADLLAARGAVATSSVRIRAVTAVDGHGLPDSEALAERLRAAWLAIEPTRL